MGSFSHSLFFEVKILDFTPPKRAIFLYAFRALVIFSFLHLALSFLNVSIFPVLLFAWGFLTFIYIPLFLLSYHILILDNCIKVYYGVFIKHKRRINLENIICTTLFKLPDANCFGLCGAVLRGVNTRIFIIELWSEETKCLLD